MSFGQHLEVGLTNLGASLERIATNFKKHRDEAIALGLISDERKLELLKAELFRRVKADEPTHNITDAIELLVELQKQEDKRFDSLGAQIDRVLTSALVLGVALTALSFVASWRCGSSRSPFCQKARVIPDAIVRQFQEPPKPNEFLLKKFNWSRQGVPHHTYSLVGEECRSGIRYWGLATGKMPQNLGGVKAPDIIFRLITQSPIPNPQSPVPFTGRRVAR
ncbi:MAG: hypothetical protein KME57_20965 [Scytonema hyalinum WJT4-NPBG1]|jgi:hypothetical protein|nr:hypothetical protein [Scytonema hyalinum WJT4-NPBG1]